MEQRKQFTFYRSFYEAIAKLKDPLERVALYDILTQYALDGIEPDEAALSDAVSMAYILMKPNLDVGRRKAESGRLGGQAERKVSKQEANRKQTASKKEKEVEIENEIEIEKESYAPHTPRSDFERFWERYPRKEGRADAEKAYGGVGVGIEVLLSALERQKGLPQWQKEGGRYIPSASHWLKGRRWEDEPPRILSPPESRPGALELEAIRRLVSS